MFFSLTLLIPARIRFALDSRIGQVDLHSLADQDYMELVVEDLDAEMSVFPDINDELPDGREWPGVICGEDSEILEIRWCTIPDRDCGSISLNTLPAHL